MKYVSCPYCGQMHVLDELTHVAAEVIIRSFQKFLDRIYANPEEDGLGPVIPLEAPAEEAPLEDPSASSPQDNQSADESVQVAEESISWRRLQSVVEQAMQESAQETWTRLPCDVEEHFVPRSYAESEEPGEATVICLVGPPDAGKTHLLASIGLTLAADVYSRIGVVASWKSVPGHWQMFREAYVDALLRDDQELLATYVPFPSHLTSLWFKVAFHDDEPERWIVVVDTSGESGKETEISRRGGYLAAVDTLVLVLDGVDLQARLRRPREFDDAIGEFAPALGEVPHGRSFEVAPISYAQSVVNQLKTTTTAEARIRGRKARMPNLLVAVSKADHLVARSEARESPHAEELRNLSRFVANDEIELSGVWRRHLVVASMLATAGLGDLSAYLLKSFYHPVYTMVSAYDDSDAEGIDKALNVPGILVNHLLALGALKTTGRFGPDMTPTEM